MNHKADLTTLSNNDINNNVYTEQRLQHTRHVINGGPVPKNYDEDEQN